MPPVEAFLTLTADNEWLWPLVKENMAPIERRISDRGPPASCLPERTVPPAGPAAVGRAPRAATAMLTSVVERSKQSAAQRAASSHRQLPLASMLEIRVKSTPGKLHVGTTHARGGLVHDKQWVKTRDAMRRWREMQSIFFIGCRSRRSRGSGRGGRHLGPYKSVQK